MQRFRGIDEQKLLNAWDAQDALAARVCCLAELLLIARVSVHTESFLHRFPFGHHHNFIIFHYKCSLFLVLTVRGVYSTIRNNYSLVETIEVIRSAFARALNLKRIPDMFKNVLHFCKQMYKHCQCSDRLVIKLICLSTSHFQASFCREQAK